MVKSRIPVFFACDDNFLKFTMVTVASLMENASKDYEYDIHILYTKISESKRNAALAKSNDIFHIQFDDVSPYLKNISYKLPIRDYYSKTTYYRLFIPDMFPEYDKAIYLDSDMIVNGDISQLYNHDLGDNYVGACNEQVMVQTKLYGDYVEQVMGLDRNRYFNAGMLVINCVQFREKKILDLFIHLLHEYTFVVTQDEDYLNLICKDKVLWIENCWDVETYGEIKYSEEDAKIIHYLMVGKPWHFTGVPFEKLFWDFAAKTDGYEEIKAVLDNYTDEMRQSDRDSCDRLAELAESEIKREDNYLKRQKKILPENIEAARPYKKIAGVEQSKSRLEVIERIRDLERNCKFDVDAEQDPPTKELLPGIVDYARKKLSSRIKNFAVITMARFLYHFKFKRNRIFVVKEIRGVDNLKDLGGTGAVITSNHFSAFDSFAMHLAYEKMRRFLGHGRFFRVIREGNYTNFPGFYGLMMRHCNTLPLSQNHKTMSEFFAGVKSIFDENSFILIYPEQSMWWNYRKPRPLKKGAFNIAVKNNVPVIPCFITMKDMDVVDGDGFYSQEYTVHIEKPIFPKKELSRSENMEYIMKENNAVWKRIYEETYNVPLTYDEE